MRYESPNTVSWTIGKRNERAKTKDFVLVQEGHGPVL